MSSKIFIIFNFFSWKKKDQIIHMIIHKLSNFEVNNLFGEVTNHSFYSKHFRNILRGERVLHIIMWENPKQYVFFLVWSKIIRIYKISGQVR